MSQVWHLLFWVLGLQLQCSFFPCCWWVCKYFICIGQDSRVESGTYLMDASQLSITVWNGWFSVSFPVRNKHNKNITTTITKKPHRNKPQTTPSSSSTGQSVHSSQWGISHGWSKTNCLMVLTAGPQPCSLHALLNDLWIRLQKFYCRQKLILESSAVLLMLA